MPDPYARLRAMAPPRDALRRAITEHTRGAEMPRVEALAAAARLSETERAQAETTARRLVTALRAGKRTGLVQSLVREYDLSTREGVALMCLAEALLRIPDLPTRDALIRDKLGGGDWESHVGGDTPLFVNAATWGLVLSGRLLSGAERKGLAGALSQVLGRCGEPVIRRGMDMAMRMMGEQFVAGETIDEALRNSRRLERKGFRHSYDMLGEAAATRDDAARYRDEYERAIHAIGRESARAGVYRGPGISVKLSALHPRYAFAQRERVMAELLPRLAALAALAARYDIGFNIDAEEADRLELSLDLLEALAFDPALAGWNGLGFVVQAYQKRAPFVLDWIVDLARRAGRRMMVRLVKGAYWDSEIKRAQVDGLADYPVFTVKAHTDISYIACARKLLDAPDAIFPQFATHNAQTLAAIHAIAGPEFSDDRYEFQCLHGMGEALYSEVAGPEKLGRPVRVYAPVGTHETLLAYLVRRLLENGANSSFVNRIQDESIGIDELVAEPAALFLAKGTTSRVVLPPDLFAPERRNSAGLDLAAEDVLACLGGEPPEDVAPEGDGEAIRNPADRGDVVGRIVFATCADADAAVARAVAAFPGWSGTPARERAARLFRAADLLEERREGLMALLVREAGKSWPNAVSELREAVDFLRYYGAAVRDGFDNATHRPLGPVACISPWNFPLAIFLGQVSAALAAGNTVLAKPAEETPLVARAAVAVLHEAGVPKEAVQLVPGAGDVGARLVASAAVRGVVFTGSTEVARAIRRRLAERLNPDGAPVPLIAETGGQNALVVDSSALAEQVVADVLSSAFDSAGQRCSALRILCVQEECADRLLTMLRGAMDELRTGDPARLDTDVGPVISEGARAGILSHVAAMRARGCPVHQAPLAEETAAGVFVPPTLIEIESIAALDREVFGPVLHVLRTPRAGLRAAIEAVNATGYALTFGVHTRIDAAIEDAAALSAAGNVYVNRNLVGAVVGVQPFGGHGLSGTGPKAGGPLYLRRLLADAPPPGAAFAQDPPAPAREFAAWWRAQGRGLAAPPPERTPLGTRLDLPGPVGEDNSYMIVPRGTVFCAGPGREALGAQICAALATGNRVRVPVGSMPLFAALPGALLAWFDVPGASDVVDAALVAREPEAARALEAELAARSGPLVALHVAGADGSYPLDGLVLERTKSVNTAAAGGNAALMMQ
ncbi:bifunctional proline dehydrogenase/L-glutamate gamma-semialdehyde dehydrogenase PutA [Acidomonas methanolica]|uniref:Bifunctional protein PutA n=3 Tax=Acidomonas methanolica TaxID=437 RepID=A0A023D8L2_ACIMT|nr:bifunctional proline dehydrogenase/L-glutamate gamma-semialdehyde dehydrogenase PutA [Acidomonas methanolica]MBU2652919.1 bifunctional proline dehydrogenase/L-glutamate gamma-semialdehyde dehydrogenase PutA [Acidomonas methanolica]TCS31322.1 L-proline dehydrogenase /delta-1-pyrroline-5-carboxylate dehydrogenase [Acidomonas methanolica]GAJ30444.1 bifunctional proline dehydrogenase/pyrroline-5-carboxylate dehydrogenase [Acidomonas methanolica NBRC 104435]GEK98429.1 bifunctional protein PutA [A